MVDPAKAIQDWIFSFLKSRDAFFRKIATIDSKEDGIHIRYKDGKEQKAIALPDFSRAQEILRGVREDQPFMIVALNNRKNREALASLWRFFASFKGLTLYFINPYSAQEKKWVIMPHVHNKVCDQSSLMQGFASLSELVDDISEEQLAARN
ncbi:MAG TPA: hypothetical protein VJB12_05445 [Candidatus Nanoarchaeia archaeon]|nr:hypothetical protein [Candidatus Nanoarchaeia archaeon]